MRKIKALLFGRDARINGLIAFLIVASVALGCTCGDLGELGKQNDDNSSRPVSNNDRTYSDDGDSGNLDDSGSPSKTMIDGLVRSMTSRFAAGVAAGDLSDFYDNALSDELKAEFSETKFKTTFSGFVEQKELASALLRDALAADPEYSETPGPRTENGLDVIAAKGSYPTTPPLKFEYSFIKNGGEWKLAKISLNTK
jgi:hypothetical protein